MSAILFIVVLVVLVLIHEFGHFLAAKKTGMRVDEFGIGFPPRLASWQKGETRFSFNAIPLGGFVKIFGEDHEEGDGEDVSRAFSKRPLWAQAVVLVAGVAANVLLAFVLFSIAFMIGFDYTIEESKAGPDARLVVLSVIPQSPAAEAGIEPGDRITEVRSADGTSAPLRPTSISQAIVTGGFATVTYEDKDVPVSKEIRARTDVPGYEGSPIIGVTMGLLQTTALPPQEAVLRAGEETATGFIEITKGIANLLYDAVLFRADLSGVAGPVGIAGLVGEAAAFGITSLLMFTAFISLNLAVINLLPFPALDGGRLVFVFIEAIKGSPVSRSFTYGANTVGFILLMMLMAAVTYNDISRLVS